MFDLDSSDFLFFFFSFFGGFAGILSRLRKKGENKMRTKKRSPLVLRRRDLEQDRFRGCDGTKGLPGTDHELAQVARLVQEIGRALAVRLCEQLPPHRTSNYKKGRDGDHGAQTHLKILTR